MQAAKWLATALLAAAMSANAQDSTFQSRSLTPETALTAARAALDSCRKQGFQVAVAVTDRAGITQVLLRDRFAGPHTVEVATNKAWTAASFRTSTNALAVETQPEVSRRRRRPGDRSRGKRPRCHWCFRRPGWRDR